MRKLLLDENVTPKAAEIFRELGYDVESVHSLNIRGKDDFYVLKVAIATGRILLTHNGKDFIVQVPPHLTGVSHKGILWFKFQVTRGNVELTCRKIHIFFGLVPRLDDSVWEVWQKSSLFSFKRFYPAPNETVHI